LHTSKVSLLYPPLLSLKSLYSTLYRYRGVNIVDDVCWNLFWDNIAPENNVIQKRLLTQKG
jgi:hypothetical protein